MNKSNKKSIIIGLSVLLLVTLTLIGLTYAYYRTRVIENPNNESISVNSDLLELTYADGTADLSTEGLIEPGFSAVKSFSVENTGNKTVKYSIVLENVDNDYVRMDDWTYTLKKSGEVVTSGVVPNSDGVIYNFVSIDKDVIDNYSLEILYNESKEDQSIDMVKSLSFKVNIIDATNASVVEQPLSGTLLSSIKRDNTADALKLISDDNNAYYYVGKPENNYVNFNEMCWKIVKIRNDGSVQLILEDQDNLCEESNGNWDVANVLFGFSYSSWYDTREEYDEGRMEYYYVDYEYTYYQAHFAGCDNGLDCSMNTAIEDFESLLPDGYSVYLLTKKEAENSIEYLINDYQINNKLSFWTQDVVDSNPRYSCNYIYDNRYFCYAEDTAAAVSYNQTIISSRVSSEYIIFRPTIILKNNVNVEFNGNGTKSNPYVIK